ncbi:MAG: lipid IV(A) 3-deoxy-D-manno-octulosonic acid transferase [Proteobacteria bacterium]|nr:lipid IV(A) 3-deoxy-D-manno-octulosonic acid transferase [Pseudomonadota bacterium]
MSRFLYTLLYYCLTPLLFLRLLIKHQKSRQYKEQRQDLRLAERLAFFDNRELDNKEFTNKGQANPIWFHTVSVGEFIATLPLIKQVMLEYPQFPLLITCTTTTGSSQIIKTFATEIKQGKIFHVYLPYDLPGSMRRFLKKTQPHLAIIMETEIWPNLLHATQQMNIPIWLLNARMSARSAKGYKRFKGLIKTTLQEFTGIAAQDKLDAERLIQLGAKAESLTITGSIKFDIQLDLKELEAGHELRQQLNWQDKKVLIAASTHQGEDEILLNVFQNLRQYYPQLVMLIVPRHPERFQSVYQLLTASDYTIAKRSTPVRKGGSAIDILLGDSMGEMMRYFSCADMVFMGGTMVPTGGHNILEPAAMGLPIVYGPHMFNFNAINELFIHYQAALQVADGADLEKALHLLLSDEKRADEMAAKAKQLIAKNAGAKDKILALLKPYLS